MNYPGYSAPRTPDPNVHSPQRTREIQILLSDKASFERLIRLTHKASRLFPGSGYSVKEASTSLRKIKARLRELGVI